LSRARRLVVALIIVAAAAAFAVFGLAPAKKSDRVAPPLPATALTAARPTLASLHGRPAFVVFWASWCGPCATEAPAIERFARSLGHHATLIGVDWNDPSTSNARAFVRRYGWTFPILSDPAGSVGDTYGLRGLPTTFVLDAQGRIAATLQGEQTEKSLSEALGRV